MNNVILNREEKRALKEWLYDELMMLCEYHYELYPRKRDSLASLMEKFYYWAAKHNDSYFPEMDNPETRLEQYLVQEFKNYDGGI